MARLVRYMLPLLCYGCMAASANAQDDGEDVVVPPVEFDTTMMYGDEEEPLATHEFSQVDTVYAVRERPVDLKTLESIRKDKAYWYANEVIEQKKKKAPSGESWSDRIFWALLIVAFIALLVWFLSSNSIALFSRRASSIASDTDGTEDENIFELDFDAEIRKAVQARDFRLGVRLMYLKLLRQLADRGLIAYTPEKTNSDYLNQLSRSEYHEEFSRLTRHFDFVWYGKFPVSAEGYAVLETDFSNFDKRLGP